MPSISNFGVWVEVDGQRLGEYDARLVKKDPSVVCHIPSQTGKVSLHFTAVTERLEWQLQHFVLCFSHDLELSAGVMAVAKVHIDGMRDSFASQDVRKFD